MYAVLVYKYSENFFVGVKRFYLFSSGVSLDCIALICVLYSLALNEVYDKIKRTNNLRCITWKPTTTTMMIRDEDTEVVEDPET